MLIHKRTPVQQFDRGLKAEDRMIVQQLALLLRHVALPLCMLCLLALLCPGKELQPLLQS